MISGVLVEFIFLYYYKVEIFKTRLIIGFIIHTIWEIWQVIIGMSDPFKLIGKNGLIDIIMDTIMFLIGMILANYYFISN